MKIFGIFLLDVGRVGFQKIFGLGVFALAIFSVALGPQGFFKLKF
jgi:hypothetical protein